MAIYITPIAPRITPMSPRITTIGICDTKISYSITPVVMGVMRVEIRVSHAGSGVSQVGAEAMLDAVFVMSVVMVITTLEAGASHGKRGTARNPAVVRQECSGATLRSITMLPEPAADARSSVRAGSKPQCCSDRPAVAPSGLGIVVCPYPGAHAPGSTLAPLRGLPADPR